VLFGRPLPERGAEAQGQTELHGIGVSPGVVTGRVRLCHGGAPPDDLQPGDILVVPALDPGWTAAYARVSGLVAERGAVLSHGAILAREFGLPAVVNVEGLAQLVDRSTIVTVNGDTGSIACHT
jgi:rifampicin phosphotransferase